MKKILFTLVLALLTGSAMAQTPEEKAAAKAAKAALKEATKLANAELSKGMACNTQIQTLSQAIQMERMKGESADGKLIAENEARIQTVSLEGIDHLTKALSTDYIKDNKKFAAYKAMDDMASAIINSELVQKAAKKQPYDRAALSVAIPAIAEACHGQLANANPSDQEQNLTVQAVKMKFPKTHIYFAYLCQFCIDAKDMDGAENALDAYVAFPQKYPEVADNEAVKNPEYPAEQLAFNIFYTAFNDKNIGLMDKYYDMALRFDDANSHSFVLRAKPQMLKEQGKTDEWIAALKEMIAQDPNSEIGEIGMQQLMSYYATVGKEQVEAYTTELVGKYPDNRVANYCRGYAFYSAGDFDNAINYFQKAVDIDADYADAVYNCAYCYYQKALAKARELSGKKMKSQAAVNAAEEEVKDYFRKAAPYFERYRELDTNDPARWASPLKVIYNNIGEKAKAAEMEAYLN